MRPEAPRKDRRKVFFVLGALSGGGAEKVVIRILRLLDRERFEPCLVLLEKKGPLIAEIPGDVRILDCGRRGAGGRCRWFFDLVRLIREQRPDLIMSFLWFVNMVVIAARALSGSACRVIVSERSTVRGSREGLIAEAVRRLAISLLYPAADLVVPNSAALREQLVRGFRLPPARVVPLPNPVDIETILKKAEEDPLPAAIGWEGPLVLGVGRLSREKGYDILIRALSRVKVPCRLLLLGEGGEEKRLRDLAAGLGLAGRIEFAGFRSNPHGVLGRAAVFVLPSRYEGFPNALVEAMALGVACVATRCPTGPEEIVTDGVNGLLVPMEDPAAMGAAIGRLLDDPALRDRLGRAARDRVRDFDAPAVVRRLEAMFEEVCS